MLIVYPLIIEKSIKSLTLNHIIGCVCDLGNIGLRQFNPGLLGRGSPLYYGRMPLRIRLV